MRQDLLFPAITNVIAIVVEENISSICSEVITIGLLLFRLIYPPYCNNVCLKSRGNSINIPEPYDSRVLGYCCMT